MRRFVGAALAVFLPLTGQAYESLTFSAVTTVQHGEGVPSVTFHPQVGGKMDVTLTCGSQTFELHRGLRPGRAETLELQGLAEGAHRCTGSVDLLDDRGATGTMPLVIEVALLKPITWVATLDDIDLDNKTLVTHPSRPVKQAHLEIFGESGVHIASVDADLSDPSHPRFSWTGDGEVVKMDVTASDGHGFNSRLELSPWYYAIPHEDVVFASGSAVVTGEEAPKLERTWTEIVDVLRRYGSVVEIQMFVAGFTDTVGTASSNQGLSERRARAIAAWFRKRGFSAQISYQGFGESVLAVQTPDETDELANRRALYVLAAQAPPVNEHLPRANWKPL